MEHDVMGYEDIDNAKAFDALTEYWGCVDYDASSCLFASHILDSKFTPDNYTILKTVQK